MSRRAEPRYWPSRKGWYVEIGGVQTRLAKGKAAKAEAYAAFHRLMAEGVQPGARKLEVTVGTLFDLLLEEVQAKKKPLTYEWYVRHLSSFAAKYSKAKAIDIRPLHVSRWLKGHGWAGSTENGAIRAVVRAFNWGVKQGYLEKNHLEGIERPRMAVREHALDKAGVDRLIDASSDQEFRDCQTALYETGMRPSEVYAIEAYMIDLERRLIEMNSKTSERVGKPRVVHLTDAMLELCRRLMPLWPEGPILRNSKGRPWTRNAMAQRYKRMRGKVGMGKEATAEAFRHGFATDALVSGTPIATVSELMGHQSTAMVEKHYSKLHERHEHLKEALDKIRPPKEDPTPPPCPSGEDA
jgi:integrase